MNDAIDTTLDSIRPSTVPLWIGLGLTGLGLLWIASRIGEAEERIEQLAYTVHMNRGPDPDPAETEAEPVEPVKTEAKAKPKKGKDKPKDDDVVAWLPEHDDELAARLQLAA